MFSPTRSSAGDVPQGGAATADDMLFAEAQSTAEQWVSFLDGAAEQGSMLDHCQRLRQRVGTYEAINVRLTAANERLSRALREKSGLVDDLASRCAAPDAARAERDHMAAALDAARADASQARAELGAKVSLMERLRAQYQSGEYLGQLNAAHQQRPKRSW